MRIKFMPLIGVLACLPLGCSSPAKAPSLVNAAGTPSSAEATESIQAVFKPQSNIELTDEDVKKGVAAGYWVTGVSPNNIISQMSGFYVITRKGRQIFRALGHNDRGIVILTLRQTVLPYVAAVGTVSANQTKDPLVSEKIVQFDYNYKLDNLPPEVREFLSGHPASRGIAVLRLSDHEWKTVSATTIQP